MFIIHRLASEPWLVSDTLRCPLSPARTSHARSFLHHPKRTPQNRSDRSQRIECTTITCQCRWHDTSNLNFHNQAQHQLLKLIANWSLFVVDYSLLLTGNWSLDIYWLQILGYHLLAIDSSWLQASAAEPAPGQGQRRGKGRVNDYQEQTH